MPFIEDFWDTHGENEVTFVKYDLNKITIPLSEARDLLPKLEESEEELFLLNTISGTISRLLREYGKDRFSPFKCCIFEPRFTFNNGVEQYSLSCIFNMNVWGIQSNNLDDTYEYFKTEAENGSIKC